MVTIDCPRQARMVLVALGALALAGCASFGRSGPPAGRVMSGTSATLSESPIRVVELTDAVARRVLAGQQQRTFSTTFGDVAPVGTVIGNGDVLDVSIWEAPPAALYGSVPSGAQITGGGLVARGASLPELMVDETGRISVPFAGSLQATGRSAKQLEADIVARLRGKANLPQVQVRIARNANATVTVVGDVGNAQRFTLTPKGERLLDALAAAGGAKQPVGKTTLQLTRDDQVVALPLEAVIRDPGQNIRLRPGDVVTALYQPYSFTALGAIGNSGEINFEATGLSLSQALGRIGGLQDNRADVKGVFVFRFEDPAALDPALVAGARTTPDGRIPVIYRVDLEDPGTFFVAQSFPIRNKDVVYVSNAPGADLQKFVSTVSSIAFSVIGISNAIQ